MAGQTRAGRVKLYRVNIHLMGIYHKIDRKDRKSRFIIYFLGVLSDMSQFVKAATTEQIQPGTCIGVKVEGVFIGIYNVEGEYYAMNNICPHLGGVLTYGFLDKNCVTCPMHMWEFDVKTGECVWPGEESIPVYPIKIEGEDILVNVDEPMNMDKPQ